MKRTFVYGMFVFTFFGCLVVAFIAPAAEGSCINRIQLLTGFYNLVRNDNRINASTSIQNYRPWNVRMSSGGWCSVSLASTCEADISETMEQYLLVDFGAEAVVEAIGTAAANNRNYLSRYSIEYARSDGQYYNVISGDSNTTLFDGNSACTQAEQIRQFQTPIIARYIRIFPLEWVGPMVCFRMELYGCFVRECPVVNNLSDNRTLLPNDNIEVSSSYSAVVGVQRDIRETWCAQGTDTTPDVILTFTEPLYMLYANTKGVSIYWVKRYSYYTIGSSGRSLYSNVDGTTVYGQTDNGQYTVRFWEPIDATVVELRIDSFVPIFACLGIKLYGCVSSEAVDHSILLPSTTSIDLMPSTSIVFSDTNSASSISTELASTIAIVTSTVTVTSTVRVTLLQSNTAIVTPTPSVVQPFNQRTASEDGCSAAAICVPVAVVVAVLVLIIVLAVIWRLRVTWNKAQYDVNPLRTTLTAVENDLYGQEIQISGSGDVSASKRIYDYPTVPIGKDQTEKLKSVSSIAMSTDSKSTAVSIKNPLYEHSSSTVSKET